MHMPDQAASLQKADAHAASFDTSLHQQALRISESLLVTLPNASNGDDKKGAILDKDACLMGKLMMWALTSMTLVKQQGDNKDIFTHQQADMLPTTCQIVVGSVNGTVHSLPSHEAVRTCFCQAHAFPLLAGRTMQASTCSELECSDLQGAAVKPQAPPSCQLGTMQSSSCH